MQGEPAETPAGPGLPESRQPPARSWRAWTVVLPCVLALVWSGLLILADGAIGVMASWDTPMPGERWATVGLAGHCLLAVGCLLVLLAGLSAPRRRRAAALTAWLIIPVAFGWLVLTARLVGSA